MEEIRLIGGILHVMFPVWEEINEIFSQGGDIFVKVSSHRKKPHKLEGSIAKIRSFDYNPFTQYSSDLAKNIRLKWDNMKNNVGVGIWELTWLKGYTGNTVMLVQPKKEKPIKQPQIIQDMVGHQINIGDIILYTRNCTKFGNVVKITDAGTVIFAPFKTPTKTQAAYLPTDCLVIRDGIKNDLMLLKLKQND
jgi:hypothetical protein